ncbi:MAG: hypothetical protein WAN35_00180 [Terracidiphilus sp.]
MNHAHFDWDGANIYHIAENDVTPDEAEEAVRGSSQDSKFTTATGSAERWVFLGNTKRGRTLLVVIALREEKIRVLTAFDPSRQEKLLSLEKKSGKP